ncbi:MAG: NAD(P)-dependent oxidoreductase [[Clostridium] scindens]
MKAKRGLVGFGNIGRLVAKKMAGFEVNILTYDPFLTQETLEGTNAPVEKRYYSGIGCCQHSCAFDKDTIDLVGRNFINEATFLFRKYSKGRTG